MLNVTCQMQLAGPTSSIEYYGTSSACFDASVSNTTIPPSKGAACFEYRCVLAQSALNLQFRIADYWYSCGNNDQKSTVLLRGNYTGYASCPRFAFTILCSSTRQFSNTTCSPGFGYHAVSKTCFSCQTGHYSNSLSQCVPCAAGTIASSPGQTACVPCEPGTRSNTTTSSCEVCPSNTYSAFGSSACTPCPESYTSEVGASSCKEPIRPKKSILPKQSRVSYALQLCATPFALVAAAMFTVFMW